MKHKLVFLSIILLAANINGMKRKRPENTFSIQTNKKQPTTTSFFELPKDIQMIIIDLLIDNTATKKPKIAAQRINALAGTNKLFNQFINEPIFNDNLIKKIANSFYCSHETIAKFLNTQASNNQLKLQYKLKQIYSKNSSLSYKCTELDELIKNGINLDFTLNYGQSHKTILMIAARDYSFLFNYLLKKSINPNASNAHGLTALHVATQLPINRNILQQLLKSPLIIIDQPDKYGETALLKCLLTRQNCAITSLFTWAIKQLISKGADPEHANNAQLTPLAVAEDLENQEIIDIIKEAIAKKHAQKS